MDQRFANGTQGRLLSWSPASVESSKVLSAGHPEITARFAKESSMSLSSMVPEASGYGFQGGEKRESRQTLLHCQVHFMDLAVRQETLSNVRGEPVLLQLPLVPCYALTTHKTQA